jgi:hypothetical protein
MVTQATLKSLLNYDPLTGIFTWKNAGRGHQANDEVRNSGTDYHQIFIGGKIYLAHRLAFLYMTGSFPSELVDHKNGNTHDNRWVNLRPATKAENLWNTPVTAKSKTGVKNVYLGKDGKYRVQVTANRVRYSIGTFTDLNEATTAAINAMQYHHGQFAKW